MITTHLVGEMYIQLGTLGEIAELIFSCVANIGFGSYLASCLVDYVLSWLVAWLVSCVYLVCCLLLLTCHILGNSVLLR